MSPSARGLMAHGIRPPWHVGALWAKLRIIFQCRNKKGVFFAWKKGFVRGKAMACGAKRHVSQRKMPCFAVQNAVFRSARCRVLQRKMPCFAARDATFGGAGRHGWGGADEKKTRKVLLISKEMSIFAHTHHHERMRKAMNQTASPTVLMPVHPCLRPQPTARRNHYQHKQQHHEPKPAIPARSPGDALRLDAAHRVCRQRL